MATIIAATLRRSISPMTAPRLILSLKCGAEINSHTDARLVSFVAGSISSVVVCILDSHWWEQRQRFTSLRERTPEFRNWGWADNSSVDSGGTNCFSLS